MTNEGILDRARELLRIEARAIEHCAEKLDHRFLEAIELIRETHKKGKKLILMGMGKSHYVAGKLAASFMSTGITAVFVHPAEAFHGDLGGIHQDDLCILISKSGATPELLGLIPFFKGNNPVISITGNVKSHLALASTLSLDAAVEKEACPINMLPTASTTAALAVGDALVSVFAEDQGFDRKTFAGYHPGGSIGKRLNFTISQVMVGLDQTPHGSAAQSIATVASKMSDQPVGAYCIVNEKLELIGILTDGDMKRILSKGIPATTAVSEVMNPSPITVGPDLLIDNAIAVMEQKSRPVNCSPVVDANNKLLGVVRLHDLI